MNEMPEPSKKFRDMTDEEKDAHFEGLARRVRHSVDNMEMVREHLTQVVKDIESARTGHKP